MADDAAAPQTLDNTPLDAAQSMKILDEPEAVPSNEYMEEAAQSAAAAALQSSKFATREMGFVGQPPSSLAALARGKAYYIDPYTPFTPRPDTLQTRAKIAGPPISTARSNHWVTQTSQGYMPKRLQNHRVPRTPQEVKLGFPARPAPRPARADGSPAYLVDERGHLLPGRKKEGRTAFVQAEEVGGASWAFTKMGYV